MFPSAQCPMVSHLSRSGALHGPLGRASNQQRSMPPLRHRDQPGPACTAQGRQNAAQPALHSKLPWCQMARSLRRGSSRATCRPSLAASLSARKGWVFALPVSHCLLWQHDRMWQ